MICVLRLRQSCNKQAGGLVFIHEPGGGTADTPRVPYGLEVWRTRVLLPLSDLTPEVLAPARLFVRQKKTLSTFSDSEWRLGWNKTGVER